MNMDEISKNVALAKSLNPDERKTKFELLFSFHSEADSKNYYSEIYHPEHLSTMVSYERAGEFIVGFRFGTAIDVKNLSTYTDCFCGIAKECNGKLFSWKLRVKID